jgi:hypothetical protein
MTRFSSAPANEQTIDSMLELARCSKHSRYIIAGSRASDLAIRLHQRGYRRVDTIASCGLPCGQYDVALIDWREHSIRALETTLGWLVHFLAPSATLVVWLDGKEKATGRMLHAMLERWKCVVEVAPAPHAAEASQPGGAMLHACLRRPDWQRFRSGAIALALLDYRSGDEIRSKSYVAPLRMFLPPLWAWATHVVGFRVILAL